MLNSLSLIPARVLLVKNQIVGVFEVIYEILRRAFRWLVIRLLTRIFQLLEIHLPRNEVVLMLPLTNKFENSGKCFF